MSLKGSIARPIHCGELARLAGVSPDTVRYYERRGLLPAVARSAAGYRLFSPESFRRVQMIRSALSLGFSVSELSHIFRERNNGGTPCGRVRKLAEEKLGALDARLRELRSCRRELRATLAEWDRMLARTPRGKQARLLETFSATHPKSATRRYPLEVMNRGNRKQEKQQ